MKGAVNTFNCGAQNLFAEASLKDDEFIQKQLDCVRGVGCCDDVGKKIKVLAPEVLNKRCPNCGPCTMEQIKRVIGEVQQRFPQEFQSMLTELKRNGGRGGPRGREPPHCKNQ